MREKLESIIKSENILIESQALDAILKMCSEAGDMRRAINILQAAFSALAPFNPIISYDLIFRVTAQPRPETIIDIFSLLRSKDQNIRTISFNLEASLAEHSISLSDLIREIFSLVVNDININAGTKSFILNQLANLE